MPPQISLNLGGNADNAVGAWFAEYWAEKTNYGHVAFAHWPCAAPFSDFEERAEFSYQSHDNTQAIFALEASVAHATITGGLCYATVAAATPVAARDGLDELRTIVPAADRTDTGTVPVTFWSYSPNGPQSVRRELDAPTWDEISSNYAHATRDELARMVSDEFRPGRGGQLILWHGEPGTGKTTAVRAVARAWRDWCEVHYVTDPDQFFGEHADYMLSVLLREEQHISSTPHGEVVPRREPWRVLLLEDAGELLAADARERTGQGLSRFLNAVDGLIGQGLRVLVLVTTNEEVKKLNPAVARPGRCAASIEFGTLGPVEVGEWFLAHDLEPEVAGMFALAELYARLEGFSGATVGDPVGFRTDG